MEELISHIKKENLRKAAWIAEDPDNRWTGFYDEDPAHWAERGILTLKDYEREQLITYIFEGHKYAFGTKGRHYNFDKMTIEELKAEAEYISEAVSRAIETEKQAQEVTVDMFKFRIQEIKDMMIGYDNEQALRILIAAEDMVEDVKFYGYESLEYEMNLPYGYIEKFLNE